MMPELSMVFGMVRHITRTNIQLERRYKMIETYMSEINIHVRAIDTGEGEENIRRLTPTKHFSNHFRADSTAGSRAKAKAVD